MKYYKKLVHDCRFDIDNTITYHGISLHFGEYEDGTDQYDSEYERYSDGYEWFDITPAIEISKEEFDILDWCDEDEYAEKWAKELKKQGMFRTIQEAYDIEKQSNPALEGYVIVDRN